jgi:hypothetical protein
MKLGSGNVGEALGAAVATAEEPVPPCGGGGSAW